jgi:hypothetical protein
MALELPDYKGLFFSQLQGTSFCQFLLEFVYNTIIKNAVFWDVAPCRSCVNRHFRGTYRLHLQGRKIHKWGTSMSRWLQTACWFITHGFFYLEDGGDTFLRNIGSHKIYTVLHPRRWHSS